MFACQRITQIKPHCNYLLGKKGLPITPAIYDPPLPFHGNKEQGHLGFSLLIFQFHKGVILKKNTER